MRIKETMVENVGTTLWSGMWLVIALVVPWDQAVVAIFAPAASWVLLYYVKKLVAYLEKTKGEKSNTKELEE